MYKLPSHYLDKMMVYRQQGGEIHVKWYKHSKSADLRLTLSDDWVNSWQTKLVNAVSGVDSPVRSRWNITVRSLLTTSRHKIRNSIKRITESDKCDRNTSLHCGSVAVEKWNTYFNTLRPRLNGRHFTDDTFKRVFTNENVRISINTSLKFVPN